MNDTITAASSWMDVWESCFGPLRIRPAGGDTPCDPPRQPTVNPYVEERARSEWLRIVVAVGGDQTP